MGASTFQLSAAGSYSKALSIGNPGGRTRLRQHEAAEGVDLALVLGERDVVRSERHRLLLRPLVGRGIVLVHQRLRFPPWCEAGKHVQLAAGRGAEKLFDGSGNGASLAHLPWARAEPAKSRASSTTTALRM